jgi:hypothetical protein
MKFFEKSTNIIGKATGSIVRGTVKGLYQGATGLTDDDLERIKSENVYNRRIIQKAETIKNWTYLISIAATCGLIFYFLGETQYNSANFVEMLKTNWAYFMPIIILNIFINNFSYQFAKETTK